MGGTVALAYAASYPSRVSRLVLVDVAGVLHRSVYAEFLARVALINLPG
jgi:pimeloyl-ACP methyl ester carboxylesterase